MPLDFELTRQYERGTEKIIAKFSDEHDALDFMEAKVAWDHKTKVPTIYKLYHEGEVTAEANAAENETAGGASGGGTGAGKRAGFSPLATSPRPSGGKVPFRHEDDIDDE